ncbi:MAG: hypothetical protein KF768_03285 [Phycisphaeraceae bacterium]|nr:hypothetical protein [Phycisphaeraceae bacterium]
MNAMDLAQLSLTLARAASVCRHVQSRLDALRSMTKDDASPVTIADFASQAVVARGLHASGSLAGGLVAEESAEFLKHPDHRAHLQACLIALRESGAWPDCTEDELIGSVDLGGADAECLNSEEGGWTLDPIDGTKGFLRGQQYCISLAFIRRGQVEQGYLACPNLPLDPESPIDASGRTPTPSDDAGPSDDHVNAQGTLFWAVAGDRASGRACTRVRALGDPGSTVFPVSRFDEHEQWARSGAASRHGAAASEAATLPARRVRLAESVESGHSNHSASATVVAHAAEALRVPLVPSIRLDSQCKYAVVARGQADVYLRLPSRKGYVERIWDHAAGMLVAQQAGCTVTDALGRELDFSLGRGLESNRGIVAAPAWLHPQVVRSIADLAPR